MKKLLLSAITALAFLFGFASCSGDLHDAQIIDLTGYCIIGSVLESGWEPNGKAPLVYNEADGTYSVTVTGTGTGSNSKGDTGEAFAIIQEGDTGWNTAYRLAQPKSEGDSAPVFAADGGTCQVYQGQSADCMVISGVEEGDKINILVKPSTTYIEVTVTLEKGAAPALPQPFYFPETMYLRGVNGEWNPTVGNCLSKNSKDALTGEVTYQVDLVCTDEGANEFGVVNDSSSWTTKYVGATITVDGEEQKLTLNEGDNNKIEGLKKDATYRFIVKTTPNGDVYASIKTICKLNVVAVEIKGHTPNTMIYVNGAIAGWAAWPFEAWGKGSPDKDYYATTDENGNAVINVSSKGWTAVLAPGEEYELGEFQVVDAVGDKPGEQVDNNPKHQIIVGKDDPVAWKVEGNADLKLVITVDDLESNSATAEFVKAE
ncbi:MAG: hypothetical protein HDR54_08240 [Treponema sp.]|nr:hypothetical protein [Treponema sp.]